MQIDHYQEKFRYEFWANSQVLKILKVSGDSFEKPCGLLAHIVSAQRIWYNRLLGLDWRQYAIWPKDSVEVIKTSLVRQNDRWKDYFTGLSPEELGQVISYHNSIGRLYETPVIQILDHLLLHGHYHRGQIGILLREAGVQPPSIGYIVFTRQMEETDF